MLDFFLSNCFPSVKIFSSIINSSIPVTTDEMQVNMPGPILFSAVINDNVHCFKTSKPIFYADDLKLIFSIDPIQPVESYTLILNDVRIVY